MAYENLKKVINKHFTEKVTEESLVDNFKFIKEHPGELNCIAEEKDKSGLYNDDTIELCIEYNKEKDGYSGTGNYISIINHGNFHEPNIDNEEDEYFDDDINDNLKAWLDNELEKLFSTIVR